MAETLIPAGCLAETFNLFWLPWPKLESLLVVLALLAVLAESLAPPGCPGRSFNPSWLLLPNLWSLLAVLAEALIPFWLS